MKVLKTLVNCVGHTDQSPCCEEVKQLCEEEDHFRCSDNPRLRVGILSNAPSVLGIEDPGFPKPIERRRRRSRCRRAHFDLRSSWRVVFIVSFSSRILVSMSRSVFSTCSWSCFRFSFVSFSIRGTGHGNPSLSSILACRNVRSLCPAHVSLGLASFYFHPSSVFTPWLLDPVSIPSSQGMVGSVVSSGVHVVAPFVEVWVPMATSLSSFPRI
mmetsp:Transcript_3614/g.22638  ORF Transcript_3614/g.22638 Transcript_3614/m.22638 type:complete len:213 (-) Transcript_3614:77-715(-)